MFPLLSVIVKVILFTPTFAHVKDVTSIEEVAIPHASEDPLSISLTERVAVPVASK